MSRRILFALLFLLWPGSLPAPTRITIGSQNTLHYGWGSTGPNRVDSPAGRYKIAEIWDTTITGNAIGLLQEVMPPANVSKFTGCVPGHCLVFTSKFYGRGSYREAYVFFLLQPLWTHVSRECAAAFSNSDCTPFSRPPAMLTVTPPNARKINVLNFHAIWGKTQAGRIAEAQQIRRLVTLSTRNADPIIVGGDWNLDAGTVARELGCQQQCAAPAELTTITTKGKRSSSYDHFYWPSSFTRRSARVLVPLDLLDWRKNVSDHLGVEGEWELQ